MTREEIETGLKKWKSRLKLEAKAFKARTKPRGNPGSRKDKPFTWRATSVTFIKVSRPRAELLAKAGEHVSPNPFCDYKKYGLVDPTMTGATP